MLPSVGKKLTSFVVASAALSACGISFFAYRTINDNFSNLVRATSLTSSTLLASHASNQIRNVIELGRLYAKQNASQASVLLSQDDSLMSVSIYHRGASGWTPTFRVTRPENHELYLSSNDAHELELKYPLNFRSASNDGTQIALGSFRSKSGGAVPVIRMLSALNGDLLQIEFRGDKIISAFNETAGLSGQTSFLISREGRVLAQTNPPHFANGEDISKLPIFLNALKSDQPSQTLEYDERPGGHAMFGSFTKLAVGNLIMVSEVPRSFVQQAVFSFLKTTFLYNAGIILLAGIFGALLSWRIIGSRLRRIGETLVTMSPSHLNLVFQDAKSRDEIGEFAQILQKTCEDIREKERNAITFSKLKNKKLKSKIGRGKVNLQGERRNILILHCRLHGMDKALSQGEAPQLIQALNDFNQSVADVADAHEGMLDHLHAGSALLFWGMPLQNSNDADNAFRATAEIRKKVDKLNEVLREQQFPEVQLGMGMHYGEVVAGQLGFKNRLEYTAMGEPIDLATTLSTFTTQLETDLLVTEVASKQAPNWYVLEQISDSDDQNPALFEITSVDEAARQAFFEAEKNQGIQLSAEAPKRKRRSKKTEALEAQQNETPSEAETEPALDLSNEAAEIDEAA